MGGRRASSGKISDSLASGPINQSLPPPNPFPATDKFPFHTLTDEDGYFKKQDFDAQVNAAIKGYLDPNNVWGSLYAPSQILNHAMRQGLTLTQSQQQMRDGLLKGMHNLGENLEMTRYCRIGYMEELGIKNYYKLNIATLQKRLVGKTYVDHAFLSASCNNFSKSPAWNPFTDKAVKLNIRAPASTKALMPGAGPGGDFGEFIFAPGQNYRITGVRWTGKKGRSGSKYYKQIELDVEMY